MLFDRLHREWRWEKQPAEGWSVDDLDEQEIRTTVREAVQRGRIEDPGTRDLRELLRGLGLYCDGTLLQAATVLFGSEERIMFDRPQCLLRVARFRGIDRTEFLDNRQFHGNAFYLLKSAERFLRDNLPIAGYIEEGSIERVDKPLVPLPATREALVNALCHRDYSLGGSSVGVALYDDRLKVTSTGTLPFGLTPEKLFASHVSTPWNPLIADAFYRRGFIERCGRGAMKMAEVTIAAGLPQPEVDDAGGCVTVRFRHPSSANPIVTKERVVIDAKSNVQAHELNEGQRSVLDLLDHADHALALSKIHSRLAESLSLRQVKRALGRLQELGFATSTGHGVSSRWNRT